MTSTSCQISNFEKFLIILNINVLDFFESIIIPKGEAEKNIKKEKKNLNYKNQKVVRVRINLIQELFKKNRLNPPLMKI
ncbi:hypothetical protein BpHYR1_048064 [Brachionus plicatilis]|uniref:Uncharacterized protein n=1 Tax=Brachionus plicatilis TaxID=10195 RepID=A0A3M7S2R3_BRAPC|nr:hypothetical protein BpHYR1_048064 [Brachionus plicatilis]